MKNFDKLYTPGKMTLGIEFPLDNDWSLEGDKKRKEDGRPFGVPDINKHLQYVKQIDKAGFAAVWIREVPVYDPNFGDGAQLFDTLSYLGYLSAATKNVLLGTAAIVSPLHQPIKLAKATATIEHLSDSRLILGLGLGDRPVEFPMYGIDYQERPKLFRDHLNIMQEAWKTNSDLSTIYPFLNKGVAVYPKPKHQIPLVVAGHSGQSLEWIAKNANGWFNYPRTPEETYLNRKRWCEALYDTDQACKPYISAFHLNLLQDDNATFKPHRFGGAVGINHLTELLKAYEDAGVNHMALHLRKSDTPLDEAIDKISDIVLPNFNS
ncbi:TIGR03571 family LLM class oxidoreductase [Psychroserpens sp. S379A]|uniref:TIGR03571 family LLM class oxidoreductase n=1 Tax=Psychroserpens sp. S379A TaxID=3415137 RepID=UPI003C7E0D49